MSKKLYRAKSGKKISGVCMGFARYFDLDVTLVRILVVALTLFTSCFPGVILYIICALVMPEEENNGTIDGSYKEM